MVTAASAAGPVGFSVPSTKPSRSRSSKYLNPWTSSTTVAAPASRPTTREASSQQRSMVAARMWNKRSPAVATARCRPPSRASNGWSSAGRGPEKRRSHAVDPIPATAASPPSRERKATVRARPERSASRSRTADSAPSSIVMTRITALAVSGVSTGWATGGPTTAPVLCETVDMDVFLCLLFVVLRATSAGSVKGRVTDERSDPTSALLNSSGHDELLAEVWIHRHRSPG